MRRPSIRISPSAPKTWGWTRGGRPPGARGRPVCWVAGGHAGKIPFELSGGQKRRVAIVSVIAMEPSVLILDEPTAYLDPVGVASILGNIHDYHTAKNATIIIVSHSMEEVARTVDRLVVINDGRIPFSGAPREVFAHGDELEAMGLGVPAMTQVFHRLRAMGVDIDPSVYTTEQARDAVLAKLGHAGQQKQSAPGERGRCKWH
ncbi:ATP-binding cassette domain-containing protein [Flavonifractor plautii]|nr:ATP-binding cassette domain-containing protein [Flavonifractor plautii]